MAYSEDAYTAGAAVGDSYGNPDVLTFVESSITHPTHADGFVDVNDPCYVGDIVGVAKESAAAATDFVSMKVAGIFSLPVVASDSLGTKAVAVGDKLFISSAGILSKIETGKFFGHALNTATASATATNITVLLGGTVDVVMRGLTDYEEAITATGALTPIGVSTLDSTGGAITGSLGSGTVIGQMKLIVMIEASASSTVSVTLHETTDPEVATFDAVDEYGLFIWTGTEWATVAATCTFV